MHAPAFNPLAYGTAPANIGHYPIDCKESMYYLYLPISLAGSTTICLPPNLDRFMPLIEAVKKDLTASFMLEGRERFFGRFVSENVYMTVKHMYTDPHTSANRPGWHADGFMTTDLNYVWYDGLPTVFNLGNFVITPDDELSLLEFDAQASADPSRDVRYPCFDLLRLDQHCVHRVDTADEAMMRTFVKITVSPEQYNMEGNSRNYGLKYDWPMHPRKSGRNQPHAEK